jgi:hypothetical protein
MKTETSTLTISAHALANPESSSDTSPLQEIQKHNRTLKKHNK